MLCDSAHRPRLISTMRKRLCTLGLVSLSAFQQDSWSDANMTSPSHERACGTTTHTESLVGALGAPGTQHGAPHLLSGVRWAATVSRRVQISSLAWR